MPIRHKHEDHGKFQALCYEALSPAKQQQCITLSYRGQQGRHHKQDRVDEQCSSPAEAVGKLAKGVRRGILM